MSNKAVAANQPTTVALLLLVPTLGIGLLWAYWPTLEWLARVWARDPKYSHGYVVPLLALLVLWCRRDRFPAGPLRPSGWGLGLVLLGAALRLTGTYFYLPWFDSVSLLPTLAGVCVLLGGWAALAWAWPAVVFLVFMLPLPYQIENGLAHPLQGLATLASTYALQTVGIPAVARGNIILIDDLEIGVLEACSGLGMLMTFFALSTAVAFMVRRPLRDKLVIFLSAVPVGVLMNLARITVTGVLFCTAGSYWAKLVFHDLAGWLMMPLALAVLWLELQFLKRLFIAAEPTGPVPLRLPHAVPAVPAPPAPRPGGRLRTRARQPDPRLMAPYWRSRDGAF